jgi:hypothetical protein
MQTRNANAPATNQGGCWTFEDDRNPPALVRDRLPIGKPESPELIQRLSNDFHPLNVAALAAPFLANEPFDSRGLVMAVTIEWQRYRRTRKESK